MFCLFVFIVNLLSVLTGWVLLSLTLQEVISPPSSSRQSPAFSSVWILSPPPPRAVGFWEVNIVLILEACISRNRSLLEFAPGTHCWLERRG